MRIETLESRRFFSVTVTEMYPGFFEVNGDQSADTIDITVCMNEETFTLEGATYSSVSYLYVHGNGGADDISIYSIDGPGSIAASITGDEGDDDITLNFDGGVWAGSGNDVMHLSDSFRGQAYGEAGNDDIYISGNCFDAEIIGDNGNDLIDCSSNNYSVVVRAGEGNDTVYGSVFNDQIYGDGGVDYLYGGEGNDGMYANGSHGGLIDGGAGYDFTYLPDGSTDCIAIEETLYS